MSITHYDIEPKGRARPHAWPEGRPLPDNGDSCWVRLGMYGPRPAGGPSVDLSAHWEIVTVTWCVAYVPAQLMVMRAGIHGMGHASIVVEWGPNLGSAPRVQEDDET